MKTPKKVAVTGAAGQIAYSLIFRIANGDFLGPDQPVSLHLLDLPETEMVLKGVKMELDDCAFPLLKEIKIGSQEEELFGDVDYAFLVGSKPRGPGMERKDLLNDNGKIFVKQGKALNSVASKDVRVLIVGNPCNTNCLIAIHNAPNIPKNHFYSMSRLDQNRAMSLLAEKAKVPVTDVSNAFVWGNHSSTMAPDFLNAKIKGSPATALITDRAWLENEFVTKVQKRGAEVIAARGKSSAASAANAAIDTFRDIVRKQESLFSVSVYSDGNPYGIEKDLVFSFPCKAIGGGKVEIVPGMEFDSFLKEKVALTQKELMEERDLVRGLLK